MRSTPTGGRPGPAFGYTGSISAHNSAPGTTCSISSRNSPRPRFFLSRSNPPCAPPPPTPPPRRVFFVYRSNPLCAASVRCFIPRQSSDALLSIYPEHQWKMENLIRVSLVALRRCPQQSSSPSRPLVAFRRQSTHQLPRFGSGPFSAHRRTFSECQSQLQNCDYLFRYGL